MSWLSFVRPVARRELLNSRRSAHSFSEPSSVVASVSEFGFLLASNASSAAASLRTRLLLSIDVNEQVRVALRDDP